MGQKFLLSKWYMDCTGANGESVIAYTAWVNWRGVRVAYNAYLVVDKTGKVITHSSMGKYREPEWREGNLFWSWREFSGKWIPLHLPVQEKLLQNENGIIDWNCQLPLAKAEIKIGEKKYLGTGYCEKMEMTIPPWKLPITELYWGRYTDPEDMVTWIEWKGTHPLQRIYYNGKRFTEFSLSDKEISFGDNIIMFNHPVEIRKGNLASTVFKSMGWIKKIFPVKAIYMREYKYAASGTFYEGKNKGKNKEKTGRVIYERVIL